MHRCPNCGTDVPADDRFCIVCGTPVAATQRKTPYLLFGIAGAVVLVLAVAIGLIVLNGSGDGDDSATAATEAVDEPDESTDEAPVSPDPTGDSEPATTAAATQPPTTTAPPDLGTTTTLAPTLTLPRGEVSAASSSTLVNASDPGRYAPSQTLDGALETAWNHCGTGCPDLTGDERQGVGVVLTYSFSEPVELVAIRVANGYQKVHETIGDVWPKNNRIASVVVRTESGSADAVLADTRGYQELTTELGITSWVELTVTGVYYGDGTYNDLALSEIEFIVRRVAVGA